MQETEKDISSLSFEEALKELEGIVKRLESGNGTLEQSIADYTRGTALRQHCEQRLEAARLKVEKLIPKADGSPETEPFPHD